MTRLAVTPELSAYIRERIDRFGSEAPPAEARFQGPYIKAHDALPLYSSWLATSGLRPDGELVWWAIEPGPVEDADHPTWVNVSLVQGARRYPPLKVLIPPRPTDAYDCDGCGGAGTIPNLPEPLKDVICRCGGIGWLSPEAKAEWDRAL